VAYLTTRNRGLAGWTDSLKTLLSKTGGAVDAYGAMQTQEQVAQQYAPRPNFLQTYKLPILAGLALVAVIAVTKQKPKVRKNPARRKGPKMVTFRVSQCLLKEGKSRLTKLRQAGKLKDLPCKIVRFHHSGLGKDMYGLDCRMTATQANRYLNQGLGIQVVR
jgi:hypothetical protein